VPLIRASEIRTRSVTPRASSLAAVAQQRRRRSAALHERAPRREAAAHDRDRAGGAEGRVERRDEVAVRGRGCRQLLAERATGDRHGLEVQQRLELLEHARHAAGAVQVLDQVIAGRADIDEERGPRGELVEPGEPERHADASCECEQVHDGVRAAADRGEKRDRVVERLRGEHGRRTERLLREPNGAPAGRLGRAQPRSVDGRDRRRARQRHAERLRQSDIVDAVPISLQWPKLGVAAASSSANSSSVMRPARSSSA
jgi:hypothetical protein